MAENKLAVFFPGIGYTVDKPLLYYSRKLAAEKGYEIRLLPYQGFPEKIRGDQGKKRESYDIALAQTREMLSDVDFSCYDDILLVGKSIGTIVAATIAQEIGTEHLHMIIYTPLDETLMLLPAGDEVVSVQAKDRQGVAAAGKSSDRFIAFTGMNDPWVGGKDSKIAKLCHEKGIRCISLENANHSLETGDAETDVEYLKMVMKMTKEFLEEC